MHCPQFIAVPNSSSQLVGKGDDVLFAPGKGMYCKKLRATYAAGYSR